MILDCLRGEILHFVQDDIQTPVVPNERSDRGALPKGKDLALPLPCHPDGVLFAGRISALNLDCIRGEILPSLCSGCCAITSFRMTTFCRPEPPQGSRSIPGHRDRLRMTIRCRPEARSPVFCRPETGVLGFCHPEGCFFARSRPRRGRISVLTLQLFGMADRKRDPALRMTPSVPSERDCPCLSS